MATSSPEAKPPAPAKSRKLIIVIVAAVLLLGAAGAAAYFMLDSGPSHAAAPAPPPDPIFVALEPFTVNLQSDGRSRFLHVGLTLKVEDAASQELVTKFLPEVRSRILSALSNREADTLHTPEQKTALAGELLATLTKPFSPSRPSARISSIMYTTFILQ